MSAANTPKCVKCTQADLKVRCALCEEKLYCSKDCETNDFDSHRHMCKFKETNINRLRNCAVCFKEVSAPKLCCTTCNGIIYCSTKCMSDNADEHQVVCQPYVDVPPRASQKHRLWLMLHFQRHPSLDFGFVWREDIEAVKNDIAKGQLAQNFHCPDLSDDDEFRYMAAYYVLWSDPNQTLGDLVAGRLAQQITGSFCLYVVLPFEVYEVIGDALPSDLHKAVHRVPLHERNFGPVKIALDLSMDQFYAGSTG